MKLYNLRPDPQAVEQPMVSICEKTSVACILYRGNALAHSTIRGIGLSVNVLRELRTASDCNRILDNDGSLLATRQTLINRIAFTSGETGEVAAGSSGSHEVYRTFHEGVCFELSLGTSGIDVDPREYADLGLVRVNPAQVHAIFRDEDRMLRSFRFTGGVRDGPDWKVYESSTCGESFEYPADATIVVTKSWSPLTNDPNAVECAEEFVANGRHYSVKQSENRSTMAGLEEWLSANGLPGFQSNLQIIAKAGTFTEYDAGAYRYFLHSGTIHILGVAGADGKPIAAREDMIFSHMLRTFMF